MLSMPSQWQLATLKKNWGTLTQIAIWVMAIIGSFLLPPPLEFSGAGEKGWQHFGQFATTVVVGLLLVAGRRLKLKRYWLSWSIFAGVSLILGVSAFFTYQHLLYVRTCPYFSETKIIGTQYTNQARHYLQSRPDMSCQQLLLDFTGRETDIWTARSIDSSRTILSMVYVSCLPLFTFALFGIIQAFALVG